MNNFPFQFLTEDALSPSSYGRKVCNYRVPTKVNQQAHQLELASLYNKDVSIELWICPEGKPGRNYRVASEFVSIIEGNTCIERSNDVVLLPVSKTPNELMVNLSKVMRKFKRFDEHSSHVLERIAILHPFDGKVLKTRIANHAVNWIKKHLTKFFDDIQFDVTISHYKQEIEFIIHAESSHFKNETLEKKFRDYLVYLKQQIVWDVAKMTLDERRKKGLTDESVNWKIDQGFFTGVSLPYELPVKNLEVFEITSKGISVGLEVSTISSEHVYTLYVKENEKKKKLIYRVDTMESHIDDMLRFIKKIFLKEFNDELSSFTMLSISKRTKSDYLSEWIESHYNRIQNTLADVLPFELYGEKGYSNGIPSKHFLWFVSNSDELKNNSVLKNAILELMAS